MISSLIPAQLFNGMNTLNYASVQKRYFQWCSPHSAGGLVAGAPLNTLGARSLAGYYAACTQ